ncbi:uncharacterized protein YbjT (DUF2867 family) [Crossiella equi]|uniref:Uncharacterized protein YbjT (DUF2867 family) n=1 Tax=Crossiella equi TaxID=130796 RepID=A0ABS5A545_9PSEU|nr:NmrA family NAD(P)-binding protein [Crossiella equi]MBP2471705.1 uncharacterized protein YbjT (DUF2867 family) [Crossiella equi]
MTYLVHGATGAQGGPVADLLKAKGIDVRPLTRSVAELDDVAALTAAYAGVEGAFVHFPLTPDPEAPARWAKAVAAAALAARPRRVVISSSGGDPADATSPLLTPDKAAALTSLAEELRAGGIAVTLVQARLFKENLLLPPIFERARTEGVLAYPVRADQPIAWASHLDVAEVVVAALTSDNAPDVVNIGQTVTGPELAEGIAEHLGREVRFEFLPPADFRGLLAPILGEGTATGVSALYEALQALPAVTFPEQTGAKALLGTEVRSTARWLAALGVPA